LFRLLDYVKEIENIREQEKIEIMTEFSRVHQRLTELESKLNKSQELSDLEYECEKARLKFDTAYYDSQIAGHKMKEAKYNSKKVKYETISDNNNIKETTMYQQILKYQKHIYESVKNHYLDKGECLEVAEMQATRAIQKNY